MDKSNLTTDESQWLSKAFPDYLDIKVNERYYHAFFGWCKIFLPPLDNGKVLIDLEAKSVKYYVIGKGYVTYGRDKNGNNTVLVDKSELFKTEDIKLSDELNLKKMCLNVTIEK